MTESDRPPTLLDPEYVAGIVDTCGKFTVSVTNGESSFNYYMQPVIRIAVPDKGFLMQHLDQFFEQYGISYSQFKNYESSRQYRVEVKSADDIKTFCDAIGPYLIGTREAAIILLEEIVPRYETDLHDSKQVFYETMAAADELRNKPLDEVRFTQDYFADIWADELTVDTPEQQHD